MITVRWKSLVPGEGYEVLTTEGTWSSITQEEIRAFPGMTHWNPETR